MSCKNCYNKLLGERKFCNNCGAKVINYRLNFKTVISEFFATFINWDNSFFKTISHLFTQPQTVVNGYLNGIRKRYLQPFAYMLIALTVYSVYMYFSKEQMLEFIDKAVISMPNQNKGNPKMDEFMDGFMEKWMSFITQYYNIFTFLIIPVLAMINRMIFKKYNIIEHNISLFYAYATYMFGYSTIGFFGLVFGISFGNIYSVTLLFMVLYHMYFYKKLFNLSKLETALKTLLFWIALFALYILLGIVLIIIIFILLKLKVISI